jgi:hypothetical protein
MILVWRTISYTIATDVGVYKIMPPLLSSVGTIACGTAHRRQRGDEARNANDGRFCG